MNFDIVKDFMDRLTAWRIPGNSIKICLNNEEVFSYQSGYSDLENKIKMTSDRLFNIYSCSKPATVTAALQLYEKGYFLLDDPLYEYIPEFRDMYIKDVNGELVKAENAITLRQLFTMTSGLNYDMNSDGVKKAREITNGLMDTVTVAKCCAADPLSFEPGQHWQYSKSHDILAAVVSVVSGKKFRDYVNENIFMPLGMNESYYHNDDVLDRVANQYVYEVAEKDIVKLQSQGQHNQGGYIKPLDKAVVTHVLGSEYDSGGAGITTSINDYSKFISALANKGVGANGERILSPGTVELLHTNQLNQAQLKDFCWAQLKGYGYGFGVRTLIDKALSGSCGNLNEFGWGGAAGATVLADTKLGLSVVYAHHMLNPQEEYYQPRLRNVVYSALK